MEESMGTPVIFKQIFGKSGMFHSRTKNQIGGLFRNFCAKSLLAGWLHLVKIQK
jgi:hypothetical protein